VFFDTQFAAITKLLWKRFTSTRLGIEILHFLKDTSEEIQQETSYISKHAKPRRKPTTKVQKCAVILMEG
jgi:hypothetical protein